jgi:hypothetical protein
MKLTSSHRLALAVLGTALSIGSITHNCYAQTAPRDRVDHSAEARALFEQGVAHADGGRYSEAITAFERSYALRESPVVLHNLAMAYRGVGRLLIAIETFERFFQNPGSRITPERLAELRRELEALKAEVPELNFAVTPANARVSIDGREVTSDRDRVRVDPGEHAVEVSLDDYVTQRLTVSAERSAHRSVQVQLVESPADAQLLVESNVDQAAISLDGRNVGQQRVSVHAEPGSHEVTVNAAGYRPVTRRVTVGRHGTVRVDMIMQRVEGVRGWIIGLSIGGAVAVGATIAAVAVVANQWPAPAPLATPPNYWNVEITVPRN